MPKIGYAGAGILIYNVKAKDDVAVLLGMRTNNPDKGLWSITGGGWEPKDIDDEGRPDYRETTRREMREEFGFVLPKENKNFLREIWSIDVLFFRYDVFALRMKSRKIPRRSFEFSMTKWFNLNEIPAEYLCNKFVHQQVNNLRKFLIKKGTLTK